MRTGGSGSDTSPLWLILVHHFLSLSFQAEEMINEIRSAFKEALDRLSWMDDQTRQAAKDKVQTQVDRLTGRVTDNN